jgi:hypothetical protein
MSSYEKMLDLLPTGERMNDAKNWNGLCGV